jgi:hypothetical protein
LRIIKGLQLKIMGATYQKAAIERLICNQVGAGLIPATASKSGSFELHLKAGFGRPNKPTGASSAFNPALMTTNTKKLSPSRPKIYYEISSSVARSLAA